MAQELTPEQWAQVEEEQKTWHEYALSTTPADFPTAEAAIVRLYELAGVNPPQRFVRVSSTASANVAIWLLSTQHGDKFKELERQALNSVQAGLEVLYVEHQDHPTTQGPTAAVDAALQTSLYSEPYTTGIFREAQTKLNQLFATHYMVTQLDTLQDTVSQFLRDADMSPSYHYFAASLDAHWLGFYETLRGMGLEFTDEAKSQLTEWISLVKSCAWWWPYSEVCVVSDRPGQLHVETQPGSTMLRLHSSTGPAIEYRDGWKKYVWHGTPVPESLIEEGWSVEQIMGERNTEVRRCAIELMGWDQFVKEAKLKLIDEKPDPGNPGFMVGLYELSRELRSMYEEPAHILLCTNGTVERDGTRRRFGLVTPAHHTNALVAAAELYDVPVEVYAKMQHRR